MTLWVNFLHIYQPPVQSAYWVRKIADECYLPLFKLLAEKNNLHVTMNISGVLLEHFERLEMNQLFEFLDRIRANGNVEFTGSSCFHAILPLLPAEECMRQIALNENRLAKAGIRRGSGFFLPEMCYSDGVAEVIEKMGYKWIILDEIACPGKTCGILANRNLKVVLRSRAISNALNTYARNLEDLLKNFGNFEEWISATDGEIYGHHKKGFWQILEEAKGDIETLCISEFLARKKSLERLLLRPCSWASSEMELSLGIPYARWHNPQNELHMLQWAITARALREIKKEESMEAREILDKALFSCQYYWTNPGLLWYPGMILKGLRLWERFFRKIKAEDFSDLANFLKERVEAYQQEYYK